MGDYTNKGHNSTQGSFPEEDGVCRLNRAKRKVVCFGKEITAKKATTYKPVLSLSLSEDVFYSLETMQSTRTTQITKFFVLARILQKLRSKT
jgi:hypothetical protein